MKPKFEGINAVYKSKADNKDIRDLLEKLVPKATEQMKEFSKSFKSASEKETCKKIFDYLKNNFKYVADDEEQIIKLPSALLNKKVGDCKSYSLFTAAILSNLQIPYSLVYTSYNANPIPQHVYVMTKNNCIIDAVYGKFNEEKKPTFKYKKDMNVRYMAGISGNCNCSGNCRCGMGNVLDDLKKKRDQAANFAKEQARKAEERAKAVRDAAARAAKEAAEKAKEIASKASQLTKTAVFSSGRNLLLLIIKNNLDGFASKLQSINTTFLLNAWNTLGGDRTILANAIKTGASKPAKKFGLLAKLNKITAGTNIKGIGAVPEIVATKIIAACSAAGTSIGGAPQGTAAGATAGKVIVELLPTLIEAIKKVPAVEMQDADAQFTTPTEAKEDFTDTNESSSSSPSPSPSPDTDKTPTPKKDNTMLYVGGGALLLAGIYFATKKK
jgi:hypothetical protein